MPGAQEKHPRAIRWFHWVNFPILALMIWSGLLTYWANDAYQPFFPDWIYKTFHLHHRLAEGMGWHFFLMWIFAINGVAYFAYTLASGEWRYLVPTRHSWKEAWPVLFHDLGIRKSAPAQAKFNAAQRISYTGIVLMGAGSLLTGLAIYKPIQVRWLAAMLGGYEAARLEHFILMLGYVGFFLIHVLQVARAGWKNFRGMVSGYEELPTPEIRVHNRRSFIVGFSSFAAGLLGLRWIFNRRDDDGIQWPLRRALQINEGFSRDFFRFSSKVPEVPRVTGREPRVNGDIGLSQSGADPASWKFRVVTPSETQPDNIRTLSLQDVRGLPRSETSVNFKCIEGWSEDMTYAGARFSDLVRAYGVGVKEEGTLFPYVGLETPDGKYYVSIDTESMLHPQTLLCYGMNGAPLSFENGAPLRLIIPIKYGIKSLKQLGTIRFADSRLPDYWAERGYDWYAGL